VSSPLPIDRQRKKPLLDDGSFDPSHSRGRTSSGTVAYPRFFTGFLTCPEPSSRALLTVANVARARHFVPMTAQRLAINRDPVVTSSRDRLRFESFSSCCGVYARYDVLGDGLDGELHDHGTTNVDVNAPLREALARVGPGAPLHLPVGLTRCRSRHWRTPLSSGRSRSRSVGARICRGDRPAGANGPAWGGRPGRGASVPALAAQSVDHRRRLGGSLRWTPAYHDQAVAVAAALAWDATIDVAELAADTGLSVDRVRAALVQLGSAGQVGYDVADAAYFHRELPYDALAIVRANPRLRNARALVEAGAVEIRGDLGVVTGAGSVQHVRLHQTGAMTCTCLWWARYGGSRGPCKHVLAVGMTVRG
jgi:SWIM zinc finger